MGYKSFLRKPQTILLVVILSISLQSCYHYRILSTVSDPATEYQKKVLWSYCWGLVDSPQQYVVPNCDRNAIDEVRITTTLGYSLISIATIGIVCPVNIEWKYFDQVVSHYKNPERMIS
jgi:hypothetical protein